MNKKAGFTLAEALLSLGLILLALGILSSLLGDFSLFQRRFFREPGAVNHTPEVLRSVASELWLARDVLAPPSGSSALLEFSRAPDQTMRHRATRGLPAFPNTIWQTSAVPSTLVRYQHLASSKKLQRQSQGKTSLLGAQVEAFSVERQNGENSDTFRLRIQVQEGERLMDWQTEVVKTRVW